MRSRHHVRPGVEELGPRIVPAVGHHLTGTHAFSAKTAMRPFLWFVVPCLASLGLATGSLPAAPVQKAPATIAVTLPADATLTIDGHATHSTSANRLFVSPPLEPGKDYFYTLQAEFRRAGKTVSVRQKVFVRAGRETAVSLEVPAEAIGENAFASETGAGETRSYYYAPGVPVPGTSSTPVVFPYARPTASALGLLAVE